MSTKTGDTQHFTSCPQAELSRICNEEKSVNSSLIPLVCNIIIIILQFNSNTQNLNHLPYAITGGVGKAMINNSFNNYSWNTWNGPNTTLFLVTWVVRMNRIQISMHLCSKMIMEMKGTLRTEGSIVFYYSQHCVLININVIRSKPLYQNDRFQITFLCVQFKNIFWRCGI